MNQMMLSSDVSRAEQHMKVTCMKLLQLLLLPKFRHGTGTKNSARTHTAVLSTNFRVQSCTTAVQIIILWVNV